MASSEPTTVEYRDIPGFIGYRVGNDGSVWSRWRNRGPLPPVIGGEWRRLKTGATRYEQVHLSKNRKQHIVYVHHLVLEAFVGPRPEGTEARHFPDSNRYNNSLSNLSWATKKQNQADRVTHGTHDRGERHHQAKLTEADVLEIRRRAATGEPRRSVAKDFGIIPDYVGLIARRKRWKHLE